MAPGNKPIFNNNVSILLINVVTGSIDAYVILNLDVSYKSRRFRNNSEHFVLKYFNLIYFLSDIDKPQTGLAYIEHANISLQSNNKLKLKKFAMRK